jgi:hypothetical protein
MNANWIAGADGYDGDFELMVVTSDDRQHVVAPSPAAMTALVALAQADTVLVWDPADRRLIAANLPGCGARSGGLSRSFARRRSSRRRPGSASDSDSRRYADLTERLGSDPKMGQTPVRPAQIFPSLRHLV